MSVYVRVCVHGCMRESVILKVRVCVFVWVCEWVWMYSMDAIYFSIKTVGWI